MAKNGSGTAIPRVEFTLNPTPEERNLLLVTLKARFEEHTHRHPGIEWQNVQERLLERPEKMASLYAMERTGGEPDVVAFDEETDEYVFFDCAAQSPVDRRKICYDGDGEHARAKKGLLVAGNAVDLARAMGIELLDEVQYGQLQERGEFDTKTESWLKTPPRVRQLGGALFGDRRYERVFVFHNSAPSFYSSRGFRGRLTV